MAIKGNRTASYSTQNGTAVQRFLYREIRLPENEISRFEETMRMNGWEIQKADDALQRLLNKKPNIAITENEIAEEVKRCRHAG